MVTSLKRKSCVPSSNSWLTVPSWIQTMRFLACSRKKQETE